MIELAGVTKQYGRRSAGAAALRDATLSIPSGSIWGVAGPNGAGKSTLLGLVLGFLRPTSGRVTISGDAPRDYLRAHGASYLPERFALPATWRVEDALRMLGRLDGAPSSAHADVLVRFGLDQHARKRVSELSRGLLQRLGLAQALLERRSLVVLDEPTEGLDPVWRIQLRDVIGELRARGATVLISSHDLAEVERMTDRVVLLEKGSIRDVLDTRLNSGSLLYRVTLATPFPGVHAAFPAAVSSGDCVFTVAVGGHAELSERLGALIAAGGTVSAVEPVREQLEDRVRAALQEET